MKFTLLNNPRKHRVRNVKNADNVEAVKRRTQQLDLTGGLTWRILWKDLGLHPYKIQQVQEFKLVDHRLRRGFGAWILEQLAVDPFFHRFVMFNDEAHFCLNGYVTKENRRQSSQI